VLVNGDIVAEGKATIENPSEPLNDAVYILSGTDETGKGLHWQGIGYHPTDANGAVTPVSATIQRIHGPPDVIDAIKTRMKPGLVLVVTDLPMEPETRSGKDFVVMNSGES
jgi:hypothetical protein